MIAAASSAHDVFFHAWHFVYQQIQLDNWFGNIVAGVVGFLVGTIAWPPTRKRLVLFVEGHVAGIHAKIDAVHAEEVAQRTQQHETQMGLTAAHHQVVLSAIRDVLGAAQPSTTPASDPAPKETT